MTDTFFMGVDVGTTAIKVAVFERTGRVRVQKTRNTSVCRIQPSWSELSMPDLWQSVARTIAEVIGEVGAESIASVGVCAQGDGLWMLDQDKEPVRNAILWNDQRAEDLILDWIRDGTSDRLAKTCRTANWPGTAGAAFQWLKQNEPAAAARAAHVVFCKDWINFCLTGNIATDFADSTIPFLDLVTMHYSPRAFSLLGTGELEGRLPEPRSGNTLHGTVTPDAEVMTGLRTGTPVATGTIDLAAMMTGLGLTATGDVCLILGTTAVVSVIIDPEPFSGPPAGATLAHPFLDKWIRVVAPASGASVLDWFAALHPLSLGGDTPGEIARRMNRNAMSVPAGANGVLFLPFLAGERAPFVAPHASGSFHGLTLSTTQADMTRAVLEGAAFSLLHCLRSAGIAKPGQASITGGGARNQVWCDIVASVLDTPIVASDESDHGLWGAALLGADAAGLIGLDDPPVRAVATRTHAPDPVLVATYQELFEIYEQCITHSQPIWDTKAKPGRD